MLNMKKWLYLPECNLKKKQFILLQLASFLVISVLSSMGAFASEKNTIDDAISISTEFKNKLKAISDKRRSEKSIKRERATIRRTENPKKGYRLIMTTSNAPGDFKLHSGSITFQFKNEHRCGKRLWFAGVTVGISYFDDISFLPYSDNTYISEAFYFDELIDEDYFGRGVCEWIPTSVTARLKAGDAYNATNFAVSLYPKQILSNEIKVKYFDKALYRLNDKKAYGSRGHSSPDDFKGKDNDQLFKISLYAKPLESME